MENEIQESVLSTESEEVAVYISGYITKKLIKRFNREDCKILLLSDKSSIADGYIKMLNRGGLLIPSSGVCSYSTKCFAILDVIHDVLIKHVPSNIKNSAEQNKNKVPLFHLDELSNYWFSRFARKIKYLEFIFPVNKLDFFHSQIFLEFEIKVYSFRKRPRPRPCPRARTHIHMHTHKHTRTHTFNIQQVTNPLMIIGHVINSSSCRIYSTNLVPH